MELKTDRLLLREVRESDLPAIFAYASDPEVCRYSPWGPNTYEQTQEFVDTCVREQGDDPRTAMTLAVMCDDVLVGVVGAGVTGPGDIEIGYTLNHAYWGRGIATEAARRLVEWAFDEFGAERVHATCRPDNGASVRVLSKIGLTQEALLPGHMWMRDHWEDSLLFSRLRSQVRPPVSDH